MDLITNLCCKLYQSRTKQSTIRKYIPPTLSLGTYGGYPPSGSQETDGQKLGKRWGGDPCGLGWSPRQLFLGSKQAFQGDFLGRRSRSAPRSAGSLLKILNFIVLAPLGDRRALIYSGRCPIEPDGTITRPPHAIGVIVPLLRLDAFSALILGVLQQIGL